MTGRTTALRLASLGLPVFPIKAGAKFPPLWAGWPERATLLPTEADFPADCNVGVHCAGLAVVDVDPKNGGDLSLLELDMDDATPLPATLTCLTPSGGQHMFYRLPEGHPGVTNGKLAEGIDIKSTRGYVLGAGSQTAAGSYAWQDAAVPVADAPQWLLDRMGEAQEARKPRDGGMDIPDADEGMLAAAMDWLKGQPVGDGAYATTCGLRDRGLSQAQALHALAAHDGRPADVLAAKVAHAYRYAQGEPGSKVAKAADFPDLRHDNLANMPNKAIIVPNNDMIVPNAVKPRQIPVSFAEMTAGAAGGSRYLIKGMLARENYAMLYGPPGKGKTFVALDMAYHVAAGKEWMGKRVKQGLVLYVGFEAYGGLRNRARALRQHYGADCPLYFTPGNFDLRSAEGRKTFGEILAELPEPPALVIFDTLAYALCGGDENSAQDVGAFNAAVQALIKATGAGVMVIHHTGKDAARGARGSSALHAAVDTELEIDEGTVASIKQRDIELAQPVGFGLVPVQIGVDEDGEAIVSCVVEAREIKEKVDRPKEGSMEAQVWDVLCNAAPDNKPMTQTELEQHCEMFLPVSATARRKAMYTVLQKLEKRGLIVQADGVITRRLE